jgi:hypothetical protein
MVIGFVYSTAASSLCLRNEIPARRIPRSTGGLNA